MKNKEEQMLWTMAEAGGPHASQWALAAATYRLAEQQQTHNDILGNIRDILIDYVHKNDKHRR
jgi:hypothetical protein